MCTVLYVVDTRRYTFLSLSFSLQNGRERKKEEEEEEEKDRFGMSRKVNYIASFKK